MLVVGGEEEGSCIASIRRAINLLNAFLLEAISEQHGEVNSQYNLPYDLVRSSH